MRRRDRAGPRREPEDTAPRERPCRWVRERLWAHVEGELPPAERASVTAHLQVCAPCARTSAVTAGAVRSLRSAGSDTELQARLADALSAAVARRIAERTDSHVPRRGTIAFVALLRGARWHTAAAAACTLAVLLTLALHMRPSPRGTGAPSPGPGPRMATTNPEQAGVPHATIEEPVVVADATPNTQDTGPKAQTEGAGPHPPPVAARPAKRVAAEGGISPSARTAKRRATLRVVLPRAQRLRPKTQHARPDHPSAGALQRPRPMRPGPRYAARGTQPRIAAAITGVHPAGPPDPPTLAPETAPRYEIVPWVPVEEPVILVRETAESAPSYAYACSVLPSPDGEGATIVAVTREQTGLDAPARVTLVMAAALRAGETEKESVP